MAPSTLPDLSRFIPYAKAAAILGVSRNEIYNKVRAGQLKSVDLSSSGTRRKPAITRASLDAYCDRLESAA